MLLAVSCSTNRQLEIFYFPIGAETFNAVTTADIEERGKRCFVSDARAVSSIVKLLDSASPAGPEQSFIDMNVRAKIIEHSKERKALLALVENNGAVRRNGSDFMLSTEALADLKTVIEMQFKTKGACDM